MGWAIIEELSMGRQIHTFLISWEQNTHVKHCYVDLSSCYELWFAIISIVILDFLPLSTNLEAVSIGSKWVNTVSTRTSRRIFFLLKCNDRDSLYHQCVSVTVKCENQMERIFIISFPMFPVGVQSCHMDRILICAITLDPSTKIEIPRSGPS